MSGHAPPELASSAEELFDFETLPGGREHPPHDNGTSTEHAEDNESASVIDDDTRPKLRVNLSPKPAASSEPVRLSIHERHQLLIHTIRLHERKWRLAVIRANPKNDRLQAFLVPINKKIELKEAISKNLVMVITIDVYGNIEVKKPKHLGPLRRILNWLVGE